MGAHLGRRKFIAISAAAGALAFLPSSGSESTTVPRLVEWSGLWLSTIRLYVADPSRGEQLLRRVVGEARRLETIFSLYQRDTVVSQLNRSGVLVAPPSELVELLRLCDRRPIRSDRTAAVAVLPRPLLEIGCARRRSFPRKHRSRSESRRMSERALQQRPRRSGARNA